jgi:hypothetical protein
MSHTAVLQQVSPLHQIPTRSTVRRRALSPQDALDLRDEYKTGLVSTRALATKFGVSPQTVHRIVTGKAYAELSTLANPKARMPWVDPPVRRRGGCEDAAIRSLAPMLKAYPNRRALVKQTKLYPHLSPCTVAGVSVVVENLANGFGVYLQWVGEEKIPA